MNQKLKKRFLAFWKIGENVIGDDGLDVDPNKVFAFFETEMKEMLERVRLERKPNPYVPSDVAYNEAVSDLDEKIKGEKI